MSNSTELPDLDKLEALARAATPGAWEAQRHGVIVAGPMRRYVNGTARGQIAAFNGTFHEDDHEDEPCRKQANAEFCAAANPAAVLALIALARRAQPEGEAPQAEPVAEFADDFIFNLRKQPNGERWPVGTKLYVHPPIAQQAAAPVDSVALNLDAQLRSVVLERNAARSAVKEYCARIERLEAALAPQQAAASGALDADEMTRLRRLMRAIGWDHERDESDKIVRGTLFTVLGRAADKLEQAAPSAPGTPEAPKLAHGHRDDFYLLANGRRLGLEPISRVRNMPNWVLAMELFATGSTSAHQICRDAGIDPDSTTIQHAAQLDGGQGEGGNGC